VYYNILYVVAISIVFLLVSLLVARTVVPDSRSSNSEDCPSIL
jgi:hypothetical protein